MYGGRSGVRTRGAGGGPAAWRGRRKCPFGHDGGVGLDGAQAMRYHAGVLGLSRRVRPVWALAGALACGPPPVDDGVDAPPAVTGPALAPCAPAEAVQIQVALAPSLPGDLWAADCEIAARSGDPGSVAVELTCAGEPAALALTVQAAPAPAGDPWAPGQAVRVVVVRSPDDAGGEDLWIRIESGGGRLLLAALAGSRLAPPDGRAWATPFTWAAVPSACMSEETDCGEAQRGALDLQFSGGPPLRLHDSSAAAAGDAGEYLALVEAALVAPGGSECPPEYRLGVLATR